MMWRPGSHALRFMLGVDNHSALGLRVERDPLRFTRYYGRGSLNKDDRLATAGAGFDVLANRSSFIHFRRLFVDLPVRPRF